MLAHRVIGPFLEAYSVLADELAAAGDQTVEQAALVETCLSLARQRWLQRTLHTPESISKDYFVNAFQLAKNQGPGERRGTGPRRTPTGVRRRTAIGGAASRRSAGIAQATGQPLLIERATLNQGGLSG